MRRKSYKRKGKFVGCYVRADIKRAIEAEAKAADRSTSYILEKILEQGVKHLMAQPLAKAA